MGWLNWLKAARSHLPSPSVIIPNAARDLAGRMVEVAEGPQYKAQLERKAGCRNLLYGEGMDEDGADNGNEIDLWNDRRCIIEFQHRTPVLIFNAPATTTVGIYYDREHPLYTVEGAAIIAPGQQFAWQLGIHRGDHEALVQTGGPVKIYRDPKRIFERYGEVQEGFFGINHHGPGTRHPVANPKSVEGYSAGCLVCETMRDHLTSIQLLKQDPRYQGYHPHVFDATVILASDLH